MNENNLNVASFDIDYLFTNISLDETIDICINKLFPNPESLVNGIFKNDFRYLLNLSIKKSFFTFNSKFCIQGDGVIMGSLLGLLLANIFLSNHEGKRLNECPVEINRLFIEGMWMILVYFLQHLILPTHFENIRLLSNRT